MGSVVNVAAKLTGEQRGLIRQAALEGRDWRETHELACAIRPVTQTLVRKMMEQSAAELSAKGEAKREGARIIHEFLDNARQGADVDDMAALLEQALYRDILRRYAAAGDPLVSMTMDELLKLAVAYSASVQARRRDGKGGAKEAENGIFEIERLLKLFEERANGADDSGQTAAGGGAACGLAE